ncbi:MAG TPA: Rid family hydrolase [Rhizomicrobium sp.]|jgi:enamine deaminase RidA (YjgF/YER057c/UK114 family)|nr:Rid family hydrolase [Rhizomicrobium sp.]
MNNFVKYGSLAVLSAALFASGANAADVVHNQENAKSPIASSTMVPPGYNTFYISGTTGKGADTAEQTAATLAGLKAQMAKMGLTFGDIVQAHVFLVADPKTGKMDFAGMNSSWMKEFGTAEQPNKPARVTVQVAGLAGGDAFVEIEFVAVKKAN